MNLDEFLREFKEQVRGLWSNPSNPLTLQPEWCAQQKRSTFLTSVLLAQVEKVEADHLVSVILMETCHIPAHGGWHDPRVVEAVLWAQQVHGVVVVVDEVMTGGGR